MSHSANIATDPEELVRRLQRYMHLLPPASAQMLDKMGGEGSGDAVASPATDDDDYPVPRASLWPALGAVAARDRAVGCLLGLAVGDAIGVAAQSRLRDSLPPLTGMEGGGPLHLPPGEWTDDTAMALCLAESLLATGDVSQYDLMVRFRAWLERGENTVSARCLDIGVTTRTAVERFSADGVPAAGVQAASSAGCGSLVRLAPLAIFNATYGERAARLAVVQSRTTHAAQVCLDACALFITQLVDALNGADKEGVVRQRVMALSPMVLFISAGEWETKTREEIHSSGYVVDTLEAALWSVWQTENFHDAVLTAANLGGEANSVGAVAGQLAGALYGASAIPPEWPAKFARGDKIEALGNALFDRSGAVV